MVWKSEEAFITNPLIDNLAFNLLESGWDISEEFINVYCECFPKNISGHWTVNALRETCRQNTTKTIFLRNENTLIGFAILQFVLDEVELLSFGVAVKYRGKSLGKTLFKHIIETCFKFKATSLFLEVDEKNLASIAIYKSFGLNKIGCRKNYYRSKGGLPGNAMLMRLNMSEIQ